MLIHGSASGEVRRKGECRGVSGSGTDPSHVAPKWLASRYPGRVAKETGVSSEHVRVSESLSKRFSSLPPPRQGSRNRDQTDRPEGPYRTSATAIR